MTKFALAVTGVMLLLTGGAAIWIAVHEAPVGMEYLTAQNLIDIGITPSNWRSQRMFLPNAVTSCRYTWDVPAAGAHMNADARVGETRRYYDEQVSREEANAKRPGRPADYVYTVTREKHGFDREVDVCTTERSIAFPSGLRDVNAEVWMQESNVYFRAHVTLTEVPEKQAAERLAWCKRQAMTLCQIMLGAVREERERKN